MSSRIPFIVGNTPGRDHIYWPTLSQAQYDAIVAGGTMPATLANARRPSCTLAQIMAISWRIKEWRLTGGWTLAASNIPGSNTVTSTFKNTPTPNAATMRTAYPENLSDSVLHDVTDEKLIVSEFIATIKSPAEYITDYRTPLRNAGFIPTLHSGVFKDTLNMTRTFGGDDSNASMFFMGDRRSSGQAALGSWGDSRGMDIVIFESGMFKPLFRFNDGVAVGPVVFRCQTALQSETPTDVFTIDPVIAPAFTAPLLIAPTAPATTDSTACDMTMTAYKFFPYKNSLGQPVYDEDTGAQLVDPFS